MPGQQGLINVARADAQNTAAKSDDWGMTPGQSATIAQDQAVSDRESSPNHRLPVLKAHPAASGISRSQAVTTSPTDAP